MAVVAALGAVFAPAASAQDGWQRHAEENLDFGVVYRAESAAGPLAAHTVTIDPKANIRFASVISGARIHGGREPVSAMCQRAGAITCVNSQFPISPGHPEPFGGVVRDGVISRTPTIYQDQISVVNGKLTHEVWDWSARLVAAGPTDGAVGAARQVEIAGINVPTVDDGIVLYTPEFAGSTLAPEGTYEVLLHAPNELRTGPDVRQPAEFMRAQATGNAPIPHHGVVLSARGKGADALWSLVEGDRPAALQLVTDTPAGLQQSFAGHPLLLVDGVEQPMDRTDHKVTARHPRTLLGWNDSGAVWLVVVDGRQSHSRGMTLDEAREHMRSLGATEAVNLDGGGSSTMVTRCGGDWCARNRPSDGQERHVTMALAVVATAPPAATAAAPAPAAPPPTAPPTTLPPTTVPATTVPPTTAPPTTLAPAVAVPAVTPSSVVVESIDAPPTTVREPVRREPVRRGNAVGASDEVAVAAPLEPLPADGAATALRNVLALIAAAAVTLEVLALRRLGALPAVSVPAGLPSTLGTVRETFHWARRLRRSRRGTGAG